ncbi:MAG TPA: fused MFS/spermidine synthase, partial [bacterium]|nr:fused MFS/spermidine synthase [bacterium]
MNPRSLVFILPVYVAFFASGAASLVAEVTWNRMLIVVVGNSLSATAMIIAVFMGGLGLGSWTGGRFLGPRRASLVPYVLLESAIAVYVLLSPAIFDALADLFRSLAAGPGDRDLLTLARVAVSLGALLLPATLMGATFPAIVSGTVAGAPDRRTARTGYLYSINTIGAALGCFAAGYHLLLELGVRFTLHVAFGLYALAAACALLAHLVRSREKSAPVAASAGTAAAAAGSGGSVAAPRDHAPRRFLAVATFTVGFVALAYEVLLTRLAILYLGNSVSVFPLVLTGFLLGTGLSAVVGTWAYGALLRAGRAAHALFGWLALAAAVFAVLTPYLLLTDLVVDAGQFARFADATPRNPLPILSIIIAPTALVGALLPVAIRMTRGERRAGTIRSAATLYALNTAGGLLGASVANQFLVPWIGVQGTVSVLAGALVAVAAAQWARSGTGVAAARWRPVSVAGIGGAAAAAVVALALPGMMDLYAAKIAEGTGARSTELHFLREGRAATVTVLDQEDPARGTYRDMY